jgi:hypothetical protein
VVLVSQGIIVLGLIGGALWFLSGAQAQPNVSPTQETKSPDFVDKVTDTVTDIALANTTDPQVKEEILAHKAAYEKVVEGTPLEDAPYTGISAEAATYGIFVDHMMKDKNFTGDNYSQISDELYEKIYGKKRYIQPVLPPESQAPTIKPLPPPPPPFKDLDKVTEKDVKRYTRQGMELFDGRIVSGNIGGQGNTLTLVAVSRSKLTEQERTGKPSTIVYTEDGNVLHAKEAIANKAPLNAEQVATARRFGII